MKITVCMATYNGSKYIKFQLDSILLQLSSMDEIIIFDDCSSDSTYEILNNINLPIVRVFRNAKNLGHVKTFELALKEATGDIIILSDQDDVWEDNKIIRIKEYFIQNPNVVLLQHSLSSIDSNGNKLSDHYFRLNFYKYNTIQFLLRQLFKSNVFGCSTSIRNSVLPLLLPFPKYVYAHDHFISLAAPLVGDVLFVPDVLVNHRLHTSNLTPKNGLSIFDKFYVRSKLVAQLVVLLKRKFSIRSKS